MESSNIPFSRRVYSGRGVLLDNLLTEVAARPELLRLVSRAKDMSDEELETLVGVISRVGGRSAPARRWRLSRAGLPTLLAGAGALVVVIGLIGAVLFLVGTVGRAAG